MAQFPQPAGRRTVLSTSARSASAIANLGALADGAGHSLRFARRPGPVRRHHRPDARGVAYATSAEMAAELGPFPAIAANRDADAARRPQSSPGRLQAGQRIRRPDHHAGRHRRALLPRLPAGTRPAQPATACSDSGREARLSQRPGHGASRRPAPSAWSWIATPPASSPISPW